MTPDPRPLSAEDVGPLDAAAESVIREDIAQLEARGRSYAGRYDILSLLATLDAERARHDEELRAAFLRGEEFANARHAARVDNPQTQETIPHATPAPLDVEFGGSLASVHAIPLDDLRAAVAAHDDTEQFNVGCIVCQYRAVLWPHATPAPLDVERLARAYASVMRESDPMDGDRRIAAKVAAAYAEEKP